MNQRIAKIRDDAGLTQEKFAEKLGVTRNFIWQLESGSRSPGDRTIRDICKAFHVDEKWLREGTGDPYREIEAEEELLDLAAKIAKGDLTEYQRAFFTVLARSTPDEWIFIEKKLREFCNEVKKEAADP